MQVSRFCIGKTLLADAIALVTKRLLDGIHCIAPKLRPSGLVKQSQFRS
jgi:hypothetical protein